MVPSLGTAVSTRRSCALLLFVVALGWMGFPSVALPAAPPAPRLFDLVYLWGSTNPADLVYGSAATLTLYKNKTMDVFDSADGMTTTNAGQWSLGKGGKTIKFSLIGGVVYQGTLQPDGTYLGTMSAPGGMNGIWQGEFR